MKKLMLALALLPATFTLAEPFAPAQQHPAEAKPPIHNGLWWAGKSGTYREGFITGYKSGAAHSAGHLIDINQFPSEELVDGLDTFYKDFRNRNILVDDALNYVQDELKGVSDDKLKASLLRMRAASAPSGVD